MGKSELQSVFKTTKKRLEGETKVNVTFRLQESLVEAFKRKCAADKVPMSATLEELLRVALKIRE